MPSDRGRIGANCERTVSGGAALIKMYLLASSGGVMAGARVDSGEASVRFQITIEMLARLAKLAKFAFFQAENRCF